MQNPLLSIVTPALSTLMFLVLPPPSYAQKYTQADLDRLCGTKVEVSRAYSIQQFQDASKSAAEENARIDNCIRGLVAAEERKQQTDAIPVGGRFPNASINGVPIRKCSHGGACNGQMIEQMRINSY
jgi:hypothetical protein